MLRGDDRRAEGTPDSGGTVVDGRMGREVKAAERIKARIAELQGIRERYLAYQQDRVSERDHHGAWDVAVNLSETECEISGLEFALKATEGESR